MALIKKANDLIDAKYKLGKNEQRLILYLLSTIQRTDKDFQRYYFNFSDLVNVLGMEKMSVYRDIWNIRESLLSNSIIFEREPGYTSGYNWCSSFDINDNDKTIMLSFHPDLMPFLLELKSKFTTYNLKYVTGFNSKHAFRIYEICKKQYNLDTLHKKRKYGKLLITINDLKEILMLLYKDPKTKEIINKYKRILDLKKNVINPAIKDINEHSDLLISVKYYKTRRSITDIEFTIKNKLANCKNEKQEKMIIADVNKQVQTQKKQEEQKQKSAEKTKIWDAMSAEDKQKNYPGGSGYIKFMAEFAKKYKS